MSDLDRHLSNVAKAKSRTRPMWGNQVRTYVLDPYRAVKDHRTGVESTNARAVLDGDLDVFMRAALAERQRQAEIKDGSLAVAATLD